MRKNNGPVARTKTGEYKIDLADDHRNLLTNLLEQLRDSLTTSTDTAALRRLFPTAYHNDPQKDAEFQRLMRDELLESRLSAIDVAIRVISQDSHLSSEEIDAFSRSINSLRLVLGTTLDIAESDYASQDKTKRQTGDETKHETNAENSDETNADINADTQVAKRELYEYLGWLLEWTVSAQSSGL